MVESLLKRECPVAAYEGLGEHGEGRALRSTTRQVEGSAQSASLVWGETNDYRVDFIEMADSAGMVMVQIGVTQTTHTKEVAADYWARLVKAGYKPLKK